MKSNSLKSSFHVSQLFPKIKKCLRLVIRRFVSFACHRCSCWSWWGRNCASVLTCKTKAVLYPNLPPLSFLTTRLCQSGHLSPGHPAQWGLYLGCSPETQYCRWTAFVSHNLAFLIPCCLMLYAEYQSGGRYSKRLSGNTMRSTTYTPVMGLLSFQDERLLSGEEWVRRTWH